MKVPQHLNRKIFRTKIWHQELSNIGDCTIGADCVIHSHVWIGDEVTIGRNCKIQAGCFIPNGVTIGNNVFIGPHVVFTNDKHPPSGGKHWMKTKVNDGASIGANTTIIPGIEIGENSQIGAGSVVTRNIPSLEAWWGNPAKFYSKRVSDTSDFPM